MSQGTRPGGLTALAVFNFVFTAMNLLSAMGKATTMALKSGALPMADESMQQALEMTTMPQLGVELVGALLTAVLQLLSGIGYLQQKRFLGRTLGNTYAVLQFPLLAATLLLMPDLEQVAPEMAGMQAFTLIYAVVLLYPLATLILLNTTFKHDFTR